MCVTCLRSYSNSLRVDPQPLLTQLTEAGDRAAGGTRIALWADRRGGQAASGTTTGRARTCSADPATSASNPAGARSRAASEEYDEYAERGDRVRRRGVGGVVEDDSAKEEERASAASWPKHHRSAALRTECARTSTVSKNLRARRLGASAPATHCHRRRRPDRHHVFCPYRRTGVEQQRRQRPAGRRGRWHRDAT